MIVTHHGLHFFKLQMGDTVIALNPISKKSKDGKPVRFGADIVLSSLNHPDTNGFAEVSRGGEDPFVINSPGEYETQGVFVKGIFSESEYAGAKQVNTMYSFDFGGMKIGTLGLLSEEIDAKASEELSGKDILFVPIGDGLLDASAAYKKAVSLEPKIIIPVGDIDSKSESLKIFLKESGVDKVERQEKLTVKQKDVEDKKSEVVVLSV
jgi:hypothetical protein